MDRKLSVIKVFCLLTFLLLLVIPNSFSQNIDYDRYGDVLRDGDYIKEKTTLTSRALSLPVTPLEIVRYGFDKTLSFLEEYHVPEKAIWLYKEFTSRDIYLSPSSGKHVKGIGGRVTLKKDKLFQLNPVVENAGFIAWTGASTENYNESGGQIVLDNIFKSGIDAHQTFQYENRPREDFFGVGRRSSLGDSNTYDYQRMQYGTQFSKEIELIWGRLSLEANYKFNDVKISNGHDTGKRDIQDFFQESALSGVNGGDYHTLGFNLFHDDRDNKNNPTRGGYRQFSMDYNQGTDGADFEYAKYKFEVAQFISILKPENILALRVAGEYNDKVDGGTLPFFDMARLGGSDTLRGFQYNRFFDNSAVWLNLEYRYNIWKYRDFKVNFAPFLDMGTIFGEGDDFEFSNAEFSYGGAFRFRVVEKVVFNVEVAKSNDGFEVYLRSKAPF